MNRLGMSAWMGLTVALLVAVSAAATRTPTAKSAPRPQSTAVSGIEIVAHHTEGTFTGYSTGSLPGGWVAVVEHTPLSPNATITGGSLTLVTTRDRKSRTLVARFTGGTITNTDNGAGCTNQTFRVIGRLTPFPTDHAGTFSVTLTHYRHRILGTCVSYFATANGSLST